MEQEENFKMIVDSGKEKEAELPDEEVFEDFIKKQNTYNLEELGKKYNIKLCIKLNPTLIDKCYKL